MVTDDDDIVIEPENPDDPEEPEIPGTKVSDKSGALVRIIRRNDTNQMMEKVTKANISEEWYDYNKRVGKSCFSKGSKKGYI